MNESAGQFHNVRAANYLRGAAIQHEETVTAAWIDAEAAGWTKEAADGFFARAQHPYFVRDAVKAAKRERDLAGRAEAARTPGGERFQPPEVDDGD